MGASQSGQTRTVTMENPTPAGVIDISDAVVHRLRNNLAKGKKSPDSSVRNVCTAAFVLLEHQPAPNPKYVVSVRYATIQAFKLFLFLGETATKEKPSPSTDGAGNAKQPKPVPPPSPGVGIPSSYPSPGRYSQAAFVQEHGGEPTITAIEVRRQKDAELAQNDLYWRRRMAQHEQTLNKTNAIMEKEYSAAIEDVRARFQNAPPTHQLPPCQDLKSQLIECYRAHPSESLKCAEKVTAFTNCVSQNRIRKLDGEEKGPQRGQ